MDSLRFEPRAFRMTNGCDTTTARELLSKECVELAQRARPKARSVNKPNAAQIRRAGGNVKTPEIFVADFKLLLSTLLHVSQMPFTCLLSDNVEMLCKNNAWGGLSVCLSLCMPA